MRSAIVPPVRKQHVFQAGLAETINMKWNQLSPSGPMSHLIIHQSFANRGSESVFGKAPSLDLSQQ